MDLLHACMHSCIQYTRGFLSFLGVHVHLQRRQKRKLTRALRVNFWDFIGNNKGSINCKLISSKKEGKRRKKKFSKEVYLFWKWSNFLSFVKWKGLWGTRIRRTLVHKQTTSRSKKVERRRISIVMPAYWPTHQICIFWPNIDINVKTWEIL